MANGDNAHDGGDGNNDNDDDDDDDNDDGMIDIVGSNSVSIRGLQVPSTASRKLLAKAWLNHHNS